MSTIISASDICLQFGLQRIFADASMTLAEGEKAGLVGRNGTGKSSLMRMLAGLDQPDSGTISRRQKMTVGWLAQEFDLDDDATAIENIRTGAQASLDLIAQYESGSVRGDQEAELLNLIALRDAWNIDTHVQTAMNELSVPDTARRVGDLSGGERRRIALARALVSRPDLLLLDEPTNHLDADSIEWLENFLREFTGAVLFVTHDRYFLDRIATSILEIDNARLFSHPGNYTKFLEAKAVRDSIEAGTERRRQSYLRHELEFVRAGVRAQRRKARTRLDKFDRVSEMEAPEEDLVMDLIIPPPEPLGNVIVEASSIGAHINGRWLFSHLDLSFEAGTVTGVIGRNGLGKSTLLRILMGERAPDEGSVNVGKRTQFNYVDQQRLQLNPDNTVMEEVAGKMDFVAFGGEKLHVRTYLRRFLFSDERVTMRVRELSGGEKSRVLLAKILQRGGNFLILDEPTNDLDLETMRVLEEAILAFDGCVLVVSHDRYFLDRVCDRLVAFEGQGRIHECAGNFSYYHEKRAAQAAAELAMVSAPLKKAPVENAAKPAARPRKFSAKEQRELVDSEARVTALEAEIASEEAAMNDPSFFTSIGAGALEYLAKLDAKRADLERVFARWAELEQLRSATEAAAQ